MGRDIEPDVYAYVWSTAVEYAVRYLVDKYPNLTNDERMEHYDEALNNGMKELLKELAYYSHPHSEDRRRNAVMGELAVYTDDDDLALEAAEDMNDILEGEAYEMMRIQDEGY